MGCRGEGVAGRDPLDLGCVGILRGSNKPREYDLENAFQLICSAVGATASVDGKSGTSAEPFKLPAFPNNSCGDPLAEMAIMPWAADTPISSCAKAAMHVSSEAASCASLLSSDCRSTEDCDSSERDARLSSSVGLGLNSGLESRLGRTRSSTRFSGAVLGLLRRKGRRPIASWEEEPATGPRVRDGGLVEDSVGDRRGVMSVLAVRLSAATVGAGGVERE